MARLHLIPPPPDPFNVARRLSGVDSAMTDLVRARIEAISDLGTEVEEPQAAAGDLVDRLIARVTAFTPATTEVLSRAGLLYSLPLILLEHAIDPGRFTVVSGYALAPSGAWLAHVFGYSRAARRIVEPTLFPWHAYLGVELDAGETDALMAKVMEPGTDVAETLATVDAALKNAPPGSRTAAAAVARNGALHGDVYAMRPESPHVAESPLERVGDLVVISLWSSDPASNAVTRSVGERLAATSRLGRSFELPQGGASDGNAAFVSRAKNWPTIGITRHPMAERGGCHLISGFAYLSDPGRYAYLFGYVLNDVSDWMAHSFLWDRLEQRLVEPTPENWLAYVGGEMTDSEARSFALDRLFGVKALDEKTLTTCLSEFRTDQEQKRADPTLRILFLTDEELGWTT